MNRNTHMHTITHGTFRSFSTDESDTKTINSNETGPASQSYSICTENIKMQDKII